MADSFSYINPTIPDPGSAPVQTGYLNGWVQVSTIDFAEHEFYVRDFYLTLCPGSLGWAELNLNRSKG